MNFAPTRLDLIRNLLAEGDTARAARTAGVEVGVMDGDFSAEILNSLPQIKYLFLVDAWQHQTNPAYANDPANVDQGGQNQRYAKVLRRFYNNDDDNSAIAGRAAILRIASLDAAMLFQNWMQRHVAFVYLDAAHDYESVLADLRAWSLVAPVLFVHDFIENEAADTMGFGVVRAVTKFCEESGWRVTALTDDDAWPTCELRKVK